MALLGLASIVALRYWFWRLFGTLPPSDDPASFIAAVVLFAVETYPAPTSRRPSSSWTPPPTR
jgi:cellulose synthase (UDP-forming)